MARRRRKKKDDKTLPVVMAALGLGAVAWAIWKFAIPPQVKGKIVTGKKPVLPPTPVSTTAPSFTIPTKPDPRYVAKPKGFLYRIQTVSSMSVRIRRLPTTASAIVGQAPRSSIWKLVDTVVKPDWWWGKVQNAKTGQTPGWIRGDFLELYQGIEPGGTSAA